MKRTMASIVLCLVIAFPLFAQKKEAERLDNSATALQQILSGGLPKASSTRLIVSLSFPVLRKLQSALAAATGVARWCAARAQR